MIPWTVINKKDLQEKEDKIGTLTKQKLVSENKASQVNGENNRLKSIINKIAPAIYGLKTYYSRENDLLYLTVTLDKWFLMNMPQYEGSIEYISEMISHSIKNELKTINLTRLPDYCRTMHEYREHIPRIKVMLNTEGSIEEMEGDK